MAKKLSDIKPILKEAVRDVVREEVKDVLRDEMKTIIREAVYSKGALSDIIAESVKGVAKGKKGSERRRKTMQESNHSPSQKTSQNGSQKHSMREKFKKLMDDDVTNGVDVAKNTEPAPDPMSQPTSPQQNGGIQDTNQKIKQLEQQAMAAKKQHARQGGDQMMARQQLQQQAQQQNGEPELATKQPIKDQMRMDSDIKEKLQSGERSKRAQKEAMKKLQQQG